MKKTAMLARHAAAQQLQREVSTQEWDALKAMKTGIVNYAAPVAGAKTFSANALMAR